MTYHSAANSYIMGEPPSLQNKGLNGAASSEMQCTAFWLDAHTHNKKGTSIPPSNMSKFKYQLNTHDSPPGHMKILIIFTQIQVRN